MSSEIVSFAIAFAAFLAALYVYGAFFKPSGGMGY